MDPAEFQRAIYDFLIWHKKRRPHGSLEVWAPHEKFYGQKLTRYAQGVRFLPGLDICALWSSTDEGQRQVAKIPKTDQILRL
jgi:hypothetical protein